MKIENIITGALFDMMGFLTSRDEQIVLSSHDNASPAVDALRAFAATRNLSLDDAAVSTWRAAIDEPAGPLPPLPEPHWKANGSFSADQVDAHARTAWNMGLNYGLQHAPAVTDIGLPELRDVLKAACLSGEPVTLSHLSAGALHYAMTTGQPQAALPPVALAAVLPLSLASDEEVSSLAHYHQGERVFRATPAPAPAGYIDSKDLCKLGNCRLPLWAKPNTADAVPVFLGAPAARSAA